ncbi:MAG TPA: zf-TFIIB domain-containing protein [Candidatus Saccharimonadales bacterium]|jgi:hypothetical protein
MNCPNDQTMLVMSERRGIEIDYCPQCRGVWLDRGELDKLLEHDAPTIQQSPQQRPSGDHYSQGSHNSEYRAPKKQRREGFLGDLFDF